MKKFKKKPTTQKSKKTDVERFSPVSEDIKDDFLSLANSNISYNLTYSFIGDVKSKQMVQIKKMTDFNKFLTNTELMVVINQELYDRMDDEAKVILFEQELAKVHVNIDNGKIKIVKPDVVTFSGILKKWGHEKVARANQLTQEIEAQMEDQRQSQEINEFFV